MRHHAYLPSMVGFVAKHVTQHFRASWPGLSERVPPKLLHATSSASKRFCEHLLAAGSALGQSRSGLLRRAAGSAELPWDLEMWSGKPDPLGPHIVHVREDRRNAANITGRFDIPRPRVKILNQNLVHAIVGNEDPDRGSAKLSVDLRFKGGHVCQLLDRSYLWP
jgi:hypothetical protein